MAKLKKHKSDQTQKKKTWFSTKPVLLIVLKSLVVVTGFFFVIRYTDTKGYFNPDESNNHTKRKWDAYYDFTENNNVDIILVGNSHLYSGINPKNLSNALGCNAFILASPGTNIADSYYSLKEALKRTDAKLVVVETFGINEFNPYTLTEGALSDQFKSFYARKNLLLKMASLPFLFRSDNYLYAWSNTLRNHEFVFSDTAQLSINKKLSRRKRPENNKLYLGRYVRFQTGIEQDVLHQYDSLGAPVKGKEYAYDHYAEQYVRKIIDLCEQERVKLVFLTLPMYEQHISDYHIWKEKLSEILGEVSNNWMDMQISPHYDGFGLFAFENTYRQNQHITYSGSLLATYKLADYIRDALRVALPNRSEDIAWKKIFYGDEGYFENYNPVENDPNNKIICADRTLGDITLNSLLHIDIANEKVNKIIAKVDKKWLNDVAYESIKLRVVLKFELAGKEQTATLDLMYDPFHRPKDEVLFTSMIKPLKILDIVDGALVKM